MSSLIQAIGVSILTNVLTVSTFALNHLGLGGLINLNSHTGDIIPLTQSPKAYYIRGLWKDLNRVINVFDRNGNQVFSFERLSSLNPVWSMLTFPERKEVATINTRFFARSITFHQLPGITHRKISSDYGLGSSSQTFYLNDGALYGWTRGSKYLEKVINPNGSIEERRERLAKVKLMRQFKFDFEMLVDTQQIRPEVALSTGFLSMLTQWGMGETTDTIGPTFISEVTTGPELVSNRGSQPVGPVNSPLTSPVTSPVTSPSNSPDIVLII